MPPLNLPSWIPAGHLVKLGAAAVLLLIPAAVFTYLEQSTLAKAVDEENRVESHRMLVPSVAAIRTKCKEMSAVAGGSYALSTPKDLPALILSLQRLAEDAGLKEARILPASETVVGDKDGIRLNGSFRSNVDAFQHFLVLLSDQPWISKISRVDLTSRESAPEYAITIKANYADLLKQTGVRPVSAPEQKDPGFLKRDAMRRDATYREASDRLGMSGSGGSR